MTGVLTGTLASGDTINSTFYQGGYVDADETSYTGAIRLVPEPSTALLLAFGLLGPAMQRTRLAEISGVKRD